MIIREMKPSEYPLLEDFLYEAIYQPDETNLAPKSIINKPELQVYIENFGREKDDYCLCAELGSKVVGAVWVRNINGYGSIDDVTPEFAISIYKEYRSQGIGTQMMREMLDYLRKSGYRRASLAVQKDNYAVAMYLDCGFKIVDENEEEYIMLYKFKPDTDSQKKIIYKATKEDVYDIADMAVVMWKNHTVEELAEEFAAAVENDKAAVFLLSAGEQAVGFAQCSLRYDYVEGTSSSPVGYLEGIFVKHEYRKQGCAKELLHECEKWAVENGCSEFASDCEISNNTSFKFHLNVGFKEANRIICFTKRLD